jgi:hypothetical protein
VGYDTLGTYYQNNILNQKQLYSKALIKPTAEIEIKQSLLGWRLYSDREYIDCASELEARYLKVWLDAGMEEIKVPKDQVYLEKIVPELETLKTTMDEVIEPNLSFIANPKTRDRILRQMWIEMTKVTASE